MRYFIELSYQGTNYCGWQRQPNGISVQQTIEEAFQKKMRLDSVPIVGCGRTDAGVHAATFTAHLDSDRDNLDDKDFIYHLNCILPHDIAIQKIYPTDKHARFDATFREYKYYISRQKNPFNHETSWLITTPLDVAKMRQASEYLKAHSDFATMCKTGSDNKTTICEIFDMEWEESENMLIFTISANRFLRGMVRAIVGTLVDVGRARIQPEAIDDIMLAKNRNAASSAAPAQGLTLTNIKY